MTAKELDKMIHRMRKYRTFNSRLEVENYICDLSCGMIAIGKIDIANQLSDLVNEIESIDTEELAKIGTFN